MPSKTPQFDKALDEYFAELELDGKSGPAPAEAASAREGGQWRTCRFSGEKFYVRPEDMEFYRKIRVPLPTLKPEERMRRKIAYLPGYEFFKVKSTASGKDIVTVYPPGTKFKIYEHLIWFSPKFNPEEFGQKVDDQVSFFEQFVKLQRSIPRPNLTTDTSNLNSDYTSNSKHLKNCYLAFDSINGENLYYFECCQKNKDCVDCWSCDDSDSCYKSWGEKLFKCFFVHNSENCLESYFLYDCKNCQNCFMSSNARNKKYYFYNTQLTKSDYDAKMKEINLGDYSILQKYLKEFEELKQDAIHKAVIGQNVINSYGTWLWDVKNCYYVSYARGCENVAYSMGMGDYDDSYDVFGGVDSELCYELTNMSSGNNYNVKFSSFIDTSENLEYCDLCWNCSNCFGCIGLTNKSYYIFNVQYKEKDYWDAVDRLKTGMLKRGEYGEFFPPEISPFPYNHSIVASYAGYDDFENAKRYGYWFQDVKRTQDQERTEVISSKDLPLDIKDADNSILEKAILDEENKRRFRITKYELQFYRKYKIPLPHIHPVIRMAEWRKGFDLKLKFYERECGKCRKKTPMMYAPDRPEKNIWCESCYLSEIG